MLDIVLSNQMKRDLKLAQKRGCNINLLKDVVNKLANQEVLTEKYQDHPLSGSYANFRECHIQPNWLLIYRVELDELLLLLFRTGTHSDLF